jgi:hypothetical protein
VSTHDPSRLPVADVQRFRRDGFVVLRDAFDPAPLVRDVAAAFADGFAGDSHGNVSAEAAITLRYLPMMSERTPTSLGLLHRFLGLAEQFVGGDVVPVRAKAIELLRASYRPTPGAPPLHLRYARAALAFMGWQLPRGLLNPPDGVRPGSPWWRAVNEWLLRDTCEARTRLLGHPGPPSSPSVEPAVAVARHPSPRTWYLAHNVTVVGAYLDHRELAERESRVERFFINLVLVRVLYAHALVAEPRLALSWLAPIGPWIGDPRRDVTVGIPELADFVSEATPAYAWDPGDRDPWAPPPRWLVRAVRRALPPPPAAPGFIPTG